MGVDGEEARRRPFEYNVARSIPIEQGRFVDGTLACTWALTDRTGLAVLVPARQLAVGLEVQTLPPVVDVDAEGDPLHPASAASAAAHHLFITEPVIAS